MLNIIPPRNIKLPEVTIDVQGLTPTLIWRFVSAVYRSGADEFKIIFEDLPKKKRYTAFSYNTFDLLYSNEKQGKLILSPIEIIQAMVNRCIGVEIIDQKKNWCIVKELRS